MEVEWRCDEVESSIAHLAAGLHAVCPTIPLRKHNNLVTTCSAEGVRSVSGTRSRAEMTGAQKTHARSEMVVLC